MRVVPFCFSGGERVDGFCFNKRLPFRIPRRESCGERHFVDVGECQRQGSQLFSRVSFRSPREILGDLLDLVELADLHRNIAENIDQTAPSVHDCGDERPPLRFEYRSPVAVVRHSLTLDLVPPDVALQGVREKDAHTVRATPERGVDDENDRPRYKVWKRNRDRIKLLAYPDVRAFAFLSKLLERLFAADIRAPQVFLQLLRSLRRLKLISAIQALVSPTSSTNAVLF